MKKKIFTIIGWAVSIVLIVSLLSKIDLSSMWQGFLTAHWSWLVFAAFINIVVIGLKAYRWKCLMTPSADIPLWTALKATVIGMAGNNVFPARGGDMMKIYLLDKWGGSGKSTLASIAGLDKVFDGLSILVLFGFLSFHSKFPLWVQRGTTIISIVLAVALAICILLLVHHRRTESADAGELNMISRIARRFGSGMEALADAKIVVITFFNSILICLLQVGTIWCCQLAFGEHLYIFMPAIVFVAINLALTIPSAPSGVGPFEVAAVVAYTWMGLHKETAFNIALMYHAVQFFPITLAGLYFYLFKRKGASL